MVLKVPLTGRLVGAALFARLKLETPKIPASFPEYLSFARECRGRVLLGIATQISGQPIEAWIVSIAHRSAPRRKVECEQILPKSLCVRQYLLQRRIDRGAPPLR